MIPAYLSIVVLFIAVKELPLNPDGTPRRFPVRRSDIAALPTAFWWVIAIAGLLSLGAFQSGISCNLKAFEVGVATTFVPGVLVVMHLVYSMAAYPFGILADRLDRRLQLGIGTVILVGADVVFASASSTWLTVLGAALWGLQLGVTQGLLGATIADVAPDRLRGTAFGIYDVAIGVGTFVASAGAGVLWTAGGPSVAFGI